MPLNTVIPDAVYRIQLSPAFPFAHAERWLGYLFDLGISHIYLSPFLKPVPGSSHGYDVVDHAEINPELGGEEAFLRMSNEARRRGMYLLMDVVPNHMGIAKSANALWQDVLENGPSAAFASFFDIDWTPPKVDLTNKVLLPFLGDQYGRVLEGQEIVCRYDNGSFFAAYFDLTFPLAPRSWVVILQPLKERLAALLGAEHAGLLELESIITALGYLPSQTDRDVDRVRERYREKEIIKRRLATLVDSDTLFRKELEVEIETLNGRKGDRRSFDRLENILAQQAYRLCFWRVAADEINYRRFFDINELAAIRIESPEVFDRVFSLPLALVAANRVHGFRLDHPDGLYDPEDFFLRIQTAAGHALTQARLEKNPESAANSSGALEPALFVVIEKILAWNERLRDSWCVHGTSGYDFLNMVNGLLVDRNHMSHVETGYREFTRLKSTFPEVILTSKKLILLISMASELRVLAGRLERISEQHRYSRDFTFETLRFALREVVAAFPAYRTYIRPTAHEVEEDDRRKIDRAITLAKSLNPSTDASVFDFIRSVLALEDPDGLTENDRLERREFVMRFQQLTGPVMAKAVEDTAFYRLHPLASLNEVGGEPDRHGVTLEEFHGRNTHRQVRWPHSFSSTSTHDTKRSEDVRARINVLSEIPQEWNAAVTRWSEMNRERKTRVNDEETPGPNKEYLLYQTLVGTYPFAEPTEAEREEYIRRIEQYMEKATKEAKVRTSWIKPNPEYDAGIRSFVRALLIPSDANKFLPDFTTFQSRVARTGIWNSLSQTILKIASPGVPEIYQGNETWDFSLVDPDNRRSVDFEMRSGLLAQLSRDMEGPPDQRLPAVERLVASAPDGRIKLFLLSRGLEYRRRRQQLFREGTYAPLTAQGAFQDNVIAFSRDTARDSVVMVAGRWFTRLGAPDHSPVGESWRDTELLLPSHAAGTWREIFTDRIATAFPRGESAVMKLSEICAALPVALLDRCDKLTE